MPEAELAGRYLAVPVDEAVEAVAREYLRSGGGYLATPSSSGLGEPPREEEPGGGGESP
jgi:hypothetical protein